MLAQEPRPRARDQDREKEVNLHGAAHAHMQRSRCVWELCTDSLLSFFYSTPLRCKLQISLLTGAFISLSDSGGTDGGGFISRGFSRESGSSHHIQYIKNQTCADVGVWVSVCGLSRGYSPRSVRLKRQHSDSISTPLSLLAHCSLSCGLAPRK